MNTVREHAIWRALDAAQTEARQQRLGVMVSHMVEATAVQCLFEHGVITKPLGSNDQPTKEHNT